MKFYPSLFIAFLAALFAFTGIEARAEAGYWPEDYVQTFAKIPVQDNGRVKPIDTYARFKLISLHGRSRHMLDKEEDIKISAVEWLLDVLMRPEVAQDYPTFQINNVEVITALELAPHLKQDGQVVKRDHYSYNELHPARDRVAEFSDKYLKIKDSSRSVVQQQIVDLHTNLSTFEGLSLLFKFAHFQLPLDPNNILAEEVPEGTRAPVSFLFENLDTIREHGTGTGPINQSAQLLEERLMRSATMLAIFPPLTNDQKWIYPAQVMQTLLIPETSAEEWERNLKRLKLMENLATQATDPDKRMTALADYRDEVVAGAKALGAYDDVVSEVNFYKWKNLLLGPWLYVVGFLILGVSWLSPRSKFGRGARWTAYAWLWIPTLALAIGITWRCILRDRPPVTNLYETILFITAVVAVMLLVIELMKRNGLALALVPFLGAAGLFLAMRFELTDGQDTISPLVAVLDTNFWLSTHVTTVTMGYAAGLAAAAVSILYILSRLIDPMKKRLPRSYYKDITGMTYGIICFGLLFSLVGTILGGIWANYSWGRFWGWDPKENGALMIVLVNLIILHGRVGGYLKQMRLHMAAVFGAIVVCYSWWGVNLLGAGLHSYGFVSGVKTALNTAYFVLFTAILIGGLIGIYERLVRRFEPSAGDGASGRRTVAANS